MNLPGAYTTKKFPVYELIGAGIMLIILIIRLTKAYIRFDWLLDTIWLASGVFLVLTELTRERKDIKLADWIKAETSLLLFSLYLFLYHFWGVIIRLKFGGAEMLLYMAATAMFALAIYLRAKEAGIDIKRFEWKKLVQYPAWPMTVGITLCLFAVFLPMTKFAALRSMYGMQFGYSAYNGWGYNNWGYNYYIVNITFKGYLANWGSLAVMLMLFMLAFQVVRIAGKKQYKVFDLFFKIAIPALLAWWLFGAKGYKAMKSFGNILFIFSLALLALSVYLPGKLDELLKINLKKPTPAAGNATETTGSSAP
jgi:hypothetical protein